MYIQVVVYVRGDTWSKAFEADLSDLFAGHVEQALELSPGPHLFLQSLSGIWSASCDAGFSREKIPD